MEVDLTDDRPRSAAAPDGGAGCRDRRAVERRSRLIEAARMSFAEHGFRGAGIAQIAKRSGIKVGQIYRDFTCKEDIVAAIVEADLADFLAEEALHRAIETGDGGALRGWITDLVLYKANRQDAPLIPEIMAEASRNERIAGIVRSADARIRLRLLAALDALLPSSGNAEALAVVADMILTMMTGLCCRDLASLEPDRALMVARVQLMVDRQIEALLEEGNGAPGAV